MCCFLSCHILIRRLSDRACLHTGMGLYCIVLYRMQALCIGYGPCPEPLVHVSPDTLTIMHAALRLSMGGCHP